MDESARRTALEASWVLADPHGSAGKAQQTEQEAEKEEVEEKEEQRNASAGVATKLRNPHLVQRGSSRDPPPNERVGNSPTYPAMQPMYPAMQPMYPAMQPMGQPLAAFSFGSVPTTSLPAYPAQPPSALPSFYPLQDSRDDRPHDALEQGRAPSTASAAAARQASLESRLGGLDLSAPTAAVNASASGSDGWTFVSATPAEPFKATASASTETLWNPPMATAAAATPTAARPTSASLSREELRLQRLLALDPTARSASTSPAPAPAPAPAPSSGQANDGERPSPPPYTAPSPAREQQPPPPVYYFYSIPSNDAAERAAAPAPAPAPAPVPVAAPAVRYRAPAPSTPLSAPAATMPSRAAALPTPAPRPEVPVYAAPPRPAALPRTAARSRYASSWEEAMDAVPASRDEEAFVCRLMDMGVDPTNPRDLLFAVRRHNGNLEAVLAEYGVVPLD